MGSSMIQLVVICRAFRCWVTRVAYIYVAGTRLLGWLCPYTVRHPFETHLRVPQLLVRQPQSISPSVLSTSITRSSLTHKHTWVPDIATSHQMGVHQMAVHHRELQKIPQDSVLSDALLHLAVLPLSVWDPEHLPPSRTHAIHWGPLVPHPQWFAILPPVLHLELSTSVHNLRRLHQVLYSSAPNLRQEQDLHGSVPVHQTRLPTRMRLHPAVE
jgi:hypothetical protein